MARPPELSSRTRATNLAVLSQEQFDLLVIGGGITGAGIARDAAARGWRVALVERRDFAAGTSSLSSTQQKSCGDHVRRGSAGSGNVCA